MAQSQNFSTGNQYFIFYMTATQTGQDNINNTSTVVCDFYLKRTNTGYTTTGTFNWKMIINGTTYSNSWYGSVSNSAVKIASQTVTVGHNSDGTKTLNMSASLSGYYSGSGGSWSMPLTTIPRTSDFSTSSSVNAGSTINITINRASTSFTHDLYLRVGDGTWLIAKGVSTSVSNWTVPNEVMNKITNAASGTGTIDCYTLSSSTIIGSVSKNITINIPSTIVPSFSSLSLERVDNGVPTAWGVYVKGKSKVKYSVLGASGSYGSWITNYVVNGCGGTWYNWQETTGELWSSGNQTFTATITDSRGRTTTKTNSITIYDYWNPYIDWFSAKRCNSDGSLNEDGQYALVQLNYGYASINNKNTPYAKVWYRRKGTESWSNEILLNNGSAKVIGSNDISSNNTYELCIRAGDYFTYVDRYVDLPSAKVTMDFRNGGNGIAIGKVAERDGLEIDWNTSFNKGISCANDTGISWYENGDGANITFHADNPSGTSYIKYNVTDDLDEYHVFGGTHWQNGWQEWVRINSSGIKSSIINAVRFESTSNGAGTNYKVGDDAYLGDCNVDNSVMVKGIQNGNAGYMRFGTGGGYIGYNGGSGSSIDICPASSNGSINQVYIGGELRVSGNSKVGDMSLTGRKNFIAENNVNSNQCQAYFSVMGWGNEPAAIIEVTKSSTSQQALVLQAGSFFPNNVGGCSLGTSTYKWSAVWATNGTIQTSDANDKENISYLSYVDEHNIANQFYISTQEQEVERQKHYDFIRGINFAKWDWKENTIEGLDSIGFIAQDIAGTEIGDRILYYDEEGGYGYSLSNYITTIAIALQHSINEVEELKVKNKELEDRLARIEAMLGV